MDMSRQTQASCNDASPVKAYRIPHAGRAAAPSKPALSQRVSIAQAQVQFELMQRTSNYYIGKKNVWRDLSEECGTSWCDWIFEEADVLKTQQQQQSRHAVAPLKPDSDFTAKDALALMPLLSLNSESVFLEVGLHCRGRLPLNLALNCQAKEYISLSPDLQQTVNASQLCSPVIQAELTKCPVKFVCAEPQTWNYRGVTHALLHNSGGGLSGEMCRAIAERLAASPSFSLLVTTSPLPFQHHLVYIGEAAMEQQGKEVQLLQQAPSQLGSSSSSSGGRPGSARAWNLDGASRSTRRAESPLPAPAPAAKTLYLYSTSYASAPVGTLAYLFCQSGVCCFPGAVFHATCTGKGTDRQASALAHSPRSPEEGAAAGSQAGGKVPPARRGVFELPPLALHTSAYQDLCSASQHV